MLPRWAVVGGVAVNLAGALVAAAVGSISLAVLLTAGAALWIGARRGGRAHVPWRSQLVRQLWAARIGAVLFAALGLASLLGALSRNVPRIVLCVLGVAVALHWIRSLRRALEEAMSERAQRAPSTPRDIGA